MGGALDVSDPVPGPLSRRDRGEDTVTVADLLARNSGYAGPPDATASDQLSVPKPPRRESRAAEAPPPAVRSTRTYLAVAAVVALVLVLGCGVVIASTAALSHPRMDRTAPEVVAQAIAGPDAVRPDVIAAALRSEAPPPARRTPARGAGGPAPLTEQAGLGNGLNLGQDTIRDPVLRTVTTFYQTASTAPADAFALLGEGMRGHGYESFEASWVGVGDVRLDAIHGAGPQAALVTVTLVQSDGGVLWTVARVEVGPAPDRRVENATLLSATTR